MACTALRLTYPRTRCPHLSRLRFHNQCAPQPALRRCTIYGIRPLYTSKHPIPSQQSRLTVSRGVRLALLLAALGTFYRGFKETPLRLENSDQKLLGAQHIDQNYLSPITPCTIQQANEILRWEEDSHIVGLGSGVQRFDSVRIASNMPCEDQIVAAASSPEDDKIRWLVISSTTADIRLLTPSFYRLMWGVFDGHA